MIRQLQNSIDVIVVKYSFIILEYDNSFQIRAVYKIPIMGFGGYRRVSKMTVNRIRLRF